MENKKLELRHVVPYPPYDLEVKANDTVAPGVMVSIVTGMPGLLLYEDKDNIEYYNLWHIKPLLIPLSVLTDRQVAILYFENDSQLLGDDWTSHAKAKRFVQSGQVDIISSICEPYIFWEKLFKDHFDVFGLIDAGLALNKLSL